MGKQTSAIVLSAIAMTYGDQDAYGRVIDVTNEFPEEGFSYEEMRAGKCRSYVRVTMQAHEFDSWSEDDGSEWEEYWQVVPGGGLIQARRVS